MKTVLQTLVLEFLADQLVQQVILDHKDLLVRRVRQAKPDQLVLLEKQVQKDQQALKVQTD
jgi:hypothetical protein